MKLGVSSLYLINKTFEALPKAIERSGVKNWEIVDEDAITIDAKKVKILNELKSSFDLEYTVHAPFADMNIASFNQDVLRLVLKRLENSLKNAYFLQAEKWIFHPGIHTGLSLLHLGEDARINLQSIRYLSRKAENLGVEIAIENMPSQSPCLFQKVAELEQFYKDLGNSEVGFAFDIGHANTVGQVDEFLAKFMDKIVHIHASDNNGSSDTHIPIGKGTIDWKSLAETLTKNKFNGFIVVETLESPIEDLKRLANIYFK